MHSVHTGIQVRLGCLLIPKVPGCSGQEWGISRHFSSCVFILLSHWIYSVGNSMSYNKKHSGISIRKGVFVINTSWLVSIEESRIKKQYQKISNIKRNRKMSWILKRRETGLKSSKFEQSKVVMALAFKNSYFSNYSMICMEMEHG